MPVFWHLAWTRLISLNASCEARVQGGVTQMTRDASSFYHGPDARVQNATCSVIAFEDPS